MNLDEIIEKRIREFETLGRSGEVTFDFRPFLDVKLRATTVTELLFCISTANSSAKAGITFQKYLEGRSSDLFELEADELEELMRKAGVRFYSRKARYAKKALENYSVVKRALKMPSFRAREQLVKLKGLGYKEASHFLRNVGRKDVAIADRHILRWLESRGFEVPKTLTPRKYLEIERTLRNVAERQGLSLAELDLKVWYGVTGKVLK